MIRTTLATALAGLLLATGSACHASPLAPPPDRFDITRPRERLPAPAFSLPRVDGGQAALGDWKGRVVLLNFWATFCEPCREEMPALQRLWKAFGDQGLVVVAVSVDRGDTQQVRRFVQAEGLDFPVLLDRDGRVREDYEITGLPTSYLIGRDGRFIGRAIGAREWDGPDARALFEGILRRQQSASGTGKGS